MIHAAHILVDNNNLLCCYCPCSHSIELLKIKFDYNAMISNLINQQTEAEVCIIKELSDLPLLQKITKLMSFST